ncbi:MAG: VOC family protein [Candidatus Doudnabacteria bacterium]|nr:VOC family protein [Candidatus Doudnabacteria bacterium]
MNKVVHFEIPVDDWDRAKKFYADNFGWDQRDMKSDGKFDYVMLHTAETGQDGMVQEKGAINGGLFKRGAEDAVPRIYIQVESIEDSIKKIEASGGKQLGKIGPIPNGRFAKFTDSEGNVCGLVDSKK